MNSIANDTGTFAANAWTWFWRSGNWIFVVAGLFALVLVNSASVDGRIYRCTNDPAEVQQLLTDGWRLSTNESSEQVSCYYKQGVTNE